MANIEEKLKKLDKNKLIDVVKNYRQYGYSEEIREGAIALLEERGISRKQLELTGNLKNRNYDFADDLFRSFTRSSKIAIILYVILLLTNIGVPALSINSDFLGVLTIIVNWSAFILYFVFLIRSFLIQNQFYKMIGQNFGAEGALLYLFLGMPLYIIMYFWFRNQMKEKMRSMV